MKYRITYHAGRDKYRIEKKFLFFFWSVLEEVISIYCAVPIEYPTLLEAQERVSLLCIYDAKRAMKWRVVWPT